MACLHPIQSQPRTGGSARRHHHRAVPTSTRCASTKGKGEGEGNKEGVFTEKRSAYKADELVRTMPGHYATPLQAIDEQIQAGQDLVPDGVKQSDGEDECLSSTKRATNTDHEAQLGGAQGYRKVSMPVKTRKRREGVGWGETKLGEGRDSPAGMWTRSSATSWEYPWEVDTRTPFPN